MMTYVVTRHKRLSFAGILIILLFPLASLADIWMDAGDVFSDTLTDGDGLTAYDGWSGLVTFSYEVSRLTEGAPLHYKYTFTTDTSGANALSHLIIEASYNPDPQPGELGSFTLDPPDYYGPAGVELQIHEATTDKPNPEMPDDLFGLKFQSWTEVTEVGSLTTFIVEFDSYRLPMWGNFYAVDGKGDDVEPWAAAHNSDWSFYDGAWDAANLPDKILVPDSAYVPVPGAALLGMLGLSYAGVRLRKWA